MKKLIFPTVIVCLIILTGMLNRATKKPKLNISKQESAINLNKDILAIMSVGQKRLLSDILWVTTLIESDVQHYKERDLNSWLYHRFNTIIHLDPKFYRAYLYGGQYLDIVKDDLLGAKEIYLKGMKQFPDDYQLWFNAGFLFAFELEEYDKAAEIYEKVVKYTQAPRFVFSILHKIKYKGGKLTLSETYESLLSLIGTLNREKDQALHNTIENDLYRIKAQIDLECLNNGKNNCGKADYFGNPYILENGKYRSKIEFTDYNIYKKN